MIPARYSAILYAAILSGLMSLLVSGIATFRAVGLPDLFVTLWIGAWLSSWAVGFPCVLLIAPIARRLVAMLTEPDG